MNRLFPTGGSYHGRVPFTILCVEHNGPTCTPETSYCKLFALLHSDYKSQLIESQRRRLMHSMLMQEQHTSPGIRFRTCHSSIPKCQKQWQMIGNDFTKAATHSFVCLLCSENTFCLPSQKSMHPPSSQQLGAYSMDSKPTVCLICTYCIGQETLRYHRVLLQSSPGCV